MVIVSSGGYLATDLTEEIYLEELGDFACGDLIEFAGDIVLEVSVLLS